MKNGSKINQPTKTHYPLGGDNIDETARQMVAKAKKYQMVVNAEYHGISLTANKYTTADSIIADYQTKKREMKKTFKV